MQGDTYINADGLVTCKVCNTTRQSYTAIAGHRWLVNHLCKCQSEKDNLEKEIMKIREYQEWLIVQGYYKKEYLKHTFANDIDEKNKTSQICRKYVENFGTMYKSGTGLILLGIKGTGKSYYSACICNALLEQGLTVAMSSLNNLSVAMQKDFKANRNEILNYISSVDLLVIDDFGTESKDKLTLGDVFSVINGRYENNKPMIVTTNYPLSYLEKPNTEEDVRVCSRILERCTYIQCQGDKRSIIGKSNRSEAEKILFS